MSIPLSTKVPRPAAGDVNGGLSPCGTGNMLKLFGPPGTKSENCSPVTNLKVKRNLVTRDVGPFNVTGLAPAVESLERIFAKVKAERPELYDQVRTAGMQCCRLIRGSTTTYSIHSWGCALDLYFGSGVVPLGEPFWHEGVRQLYPYFHAEGWYAGVEFSRCDGMHLEVAAETIKRWEANKRFK